MNKKVVKIIADNLIQIADQNNYNELDFSIGVLMNYFNIELIDNTNLFPDNPESMLNYFDNQDLIPDYFYKNFSNTDDIIPLSFGNVIQEKMIYFETVQKIPKIIHQIWLGDKSKMPTKLLDHCKNLYLQNGWNYYLWTDDDQSLFEKFLINKKLFSEQTELNSKADILRYEILFRYGGIVIDADTHCIRTMDEIIEKTYSSNHKLFAACENEQHRAGLIAAGTQGTQPYSLSYYIILRSLQLLDRPLRLYQRRRSIGWVVTGPVFLTLIVHKFKFPIQLFHSKLFYPLHWSEIQKYDDNINEINRRLLEESEKYDSFTLQYWGTTVLNRH